MLQKMSIIFLYILINAFQVVSFYPLPIYLILWFYKSEENVSISEKVAKM